MSYHGTDGPPTLRDGPALTGTGVWCSDADARMVRRLATSGFDWVGLDLQHGRYDRADLIEIARTLPADGAALAVRVPAVDATAIGLALDVGAGSVIVPQVEDVDDARAAVAAMYYPPLGRRSFGPLTPLWGVPAPDPASANEHVDCAVMIESAGALDAVDDIAAVEGVTCLFVGPFDLSLSLGRPVAEVLADRSAGSPLSRIVGAARAHGIRVGLFVGDPVTARSLEEIGFDAVATVTDTWILAAGIRSAFG